MKMKITQDDLSGYKIARFLEENIEDMKAISPPESKHALDLEGLRKPEITFWTVWDDDNLVGCGALKELDSRHGEIKSMRTLCVYRQKGIASLLLQHIINEANKRGYHRLSLELAQCHFSSLLDNCTLNSGSLCAHHSSTIKKIQIASL
jgi:putative acetyltransferase